MTTTIPAELDATNWETIEPHFEELRTREVTSRAELDRWLEDRSELEAACSESGARLYINMTCNTDDAEREQAYLAFVRNVQPKLEPAGFALDQRHAQLIKQLDADDERLRVLNRDTAAEVELFRDENIPVKTELTELGQKYQKISGAMTVEFDGGERTLPQMAKYQERTDRGTREGAWRAVADRRMSDVDAIDDILDQQVKLRQRLAQNAGLPNFVAYAFKSKKRFDYTPEDCFRFHSAVEAEVMPFVFELSRKHRAELDVGSLRPWDLAVDSKNRGPLQPFEGGAELVEKSRRVFDRMDADGLGAMFRTMGDGANTRGIDGGLLDLDSRKGKAPGGYQYMQDRTRVPFIFMNAAGQHRDVETMLHEAGHAFHSMLSKHDPLLHYRHSPIEFAEVASMSMELLTMPYWDSFYPDEEDLNRARREQIEGSVSILPWIMTIDALQHWMYTNPDHTREARREHWLGLDERFGHAYSAGSGEAMVDWSGLERYRPHQWQRQSHLFGVPFYYIEYGIAQLGALQLWVKSLEEGEQAALSAYKNAIKLGGSKPLPELFAAAGIEFDFGAATVGRLVERVRAELDKLPD